MALRAPKNSIGERLRKARAARGLELDQAATDTRIEERYLESLERDAAPGEFGGPIYARIFLREYARYLGLNPKPLVGAYRSAHPEPERPLIGGPVPVERASGRLLKPVLVVASVILLGVLAVMSARNRDSDVAVPERSSAPAPASPAPAVTVPVGEEPASESNRMVLRVVDDDCWVRIARGEQVLLEGTFEPGFSRSFPVSQPLDLALGSAGAVRLSLGGEPLPPLGEIGDVYYGSVVLREGEVRLVSEP